MGGQQTLRLRVRPVALESREVEIEAAPTDTLHDVEKTLIAQGILAPDAEYRWHVVTADGEEVPVPPKATVGEIVKAYSPKELKVLAYTWVNWGWLPNIKIINKGEVRIVKAVRGADKGDVKERAREKLSRYLKELGCREVYGNVYGEWWWRCTVCGLEVYVEVPEGWPLPEGTSMPTRLGFWIFSIPERRLVELPIFYDFAMSPKDILKLIEIRLKEMGVCESN